jgi:hypothetical protein
MVHGINQRLRPASGDQKLKMILYYKENEKCRMKNQYF